MVDLTYILCLLTFTLTITLVSAGHDPILNGDPCKIDVDCLSSCCDNDHDYSKEGVCVEIDEDSRCKSRRTVSQIVLVTYLGIFVLLIVVCGFMKHAQVSKEKVRIRSLKFETDDEDFDRILSPGVQTSQEKPRMGLNGTETQSLLTSKVSTQRTDSDAKHIQQS